MIKIKTGNIFTTKCQTITNTVNCVGVMGAGIAYEFKLRHLEMFTKYQAFCNSKAMKIGHLWLYQPSKRHSEHYQQVLNFPTKQHWKYPTKTEYLEKGLQKLLDTYKKREIKSIAFPLLGADKGGLGADKSMQIMEKYLEKLDIPVEIWHFDPTAKDDLYEDFKDKFLNLELSVIKEKSKLRVDFIEKIKIALERNDINSLSGLLRVKGIGSVSLEKSFNFIKSNDNF